MDTIVKVPGGMRAVFSRLVRETTNSNVKIYRPISKDGDLVDSTCYTTRGDHVEVLTKAIKDAGHIIEETTRKQHGQVTITVAAPA